MNRKMNKTTGTRKSNKGKAAVAAAAAGASVSMFEPLEDRKMFSVVTVNGTNANDVIALAMNSQIVRVSVNGVGRAYIASRVDGIEINGFDGADRVVAGPSFSRPVTFHGGNGNDAMVGGRANDTFDGGAGNDLMNASIGADVFLGGPDTDLMDYSGTWAGINVTLDDAANDGLLAGAEGDNIHSDVENVNGGLGNDTITGGGGNDTLEGHEHRDTLYGNSGCDDLLGRGGDDHLEGGPSGCDAARGMEGAPDAAIVWDDNSGNDTAYGGSGAPDKCYVGNQDFADLGSCELIYSP